MPYPETMAVKAVKGFVFPYPGVFGRFIGYRKLKKKEIGKVEPDHVMPNGSSYVLTNEIENISARGNRRAILKSIKRGELEDASKSALLKTPNNPDLNENKGAKGKASKEEGKE